jgi:hypothetical protein
MEMVHGVGGPAVHGVPWTWFIPLWGDLIRDVGHESDG